MAWSSAEGYTAYIIEYKKYKGGQMQQTQTRKSMGKLNKYSLQKLMKSFNS